MYCQPGKLAGKVVLFDLLSPTTSRVGQCPFIDPIYQPPLSSSFRKGVRPECKAKHTYSTVGKSISQTA